MGDLLTADICQSVFIVDGPHISVRQIHFIQKLGTEIRKGMVALRTSSLKDCIAMVTFRAAPTHSLNR